MINVFIGYDEGEKAAYSVLAESIRKHASEPVSITPVSLNNIPKFKREMQDSQSTQFAFSRFMVPHMSKYEGWSIFMDCDMMFRSDIAELWNMRDSKYAIMCCQHDYTPKQDIKFRGAKNEAFEKKNWSSLMMFNNELCWQLQPPYVSKVGGLELHQFKWLPHPSWEQIGSIPLEWNWLVTEYDYNREAKNVHWTLGGPWFNDYKYCDYADEWFEIYHDIVFTDPIIRDTRNDPFKGTSIEGKD